MDSYFECTCLSLGQIIVTLLTFSLPSYSLNNHIRLDACGYICSMACAE